MKKMPLRWQFFQLFAWTTAYSAGLALSLLWGFLFILAVAFILSVFR